MLTAAHCVTEVLDGSETIDDSFYMFTGAYSNRYYRNPQHSPYVARYRVDEIVVNPKWLNKGWRMIYDDIALIKTDKAIRMSKCVQPICLPETATSLKANGKLFVAGWGETRGTHRNPSGEYEPKEYMRWVDVPYVPINQCNAQLGMNPRDGKSWLNPAADYQSQLCAGHRRGGKDACQGDSGGPLFQMSGKRRYTQYGVVSWGLGCARAGKPGVYTSVAHYKSWIESIIS